MGLWEDHGKIMGRSWEYHGDMLFQRGDPNVNHEPSNYSYITRVCHQIHQPFRTGSW